MPSGLLSCAAMERHPSSAIGHQDLALGQQEENDNQLALKQAGSVQCPDTRHEMRPSRFSGAPSFHVP